MFFFSHRNLFDRWRKGQTSRVWVTVPWGLCETQRKQATNVCKQTHLSHLRKVGFSLKFCLNLGIILSSVFSKFVNFYVDFYGKYTIFLRNNFFKKINLCRKYVLWYRVTNKIYNNLWLKNFSDFFFQSDGDISSNGWCNCTGEIIQAHLAVSGPRCKQTGRNISQKSRNRETDGAHGSGFWRVCAEPISAIATDLCTIATVMVLIMLWTYQDFYKLIVLWIFLCTVCDICWIYW